MPCGKPTNRLLVGGNPIVDECVTEGTSVAPRLLVIKGTGAPSSWLSLHGKTFERFHTKFKQQPTF